MKNTVRINLIAIGLILGGFMRNLLVTFLIVCLSLFLTANLSADWLIGDGHKMHFPQLPNVAGWDVNATYPVALADDWTCGETGWVKDIHFWGGWEQNMAGQIDAFIISVYTDIPVDPPMFPYSRPGNKLWEVVVTDFIVAEPFYPPAPAGWYAPWFGYHNLNDHLAYYQYNVFLPEPEWFWQVEGVVYWLEITAVLSGGQTHWGWRSSTEHHLDDAVYGNFFSTCTARDNGNGTINLPADCPYTSTIETIDIIDGLPPGTEINSVPVLDGYYNIIVTPGGTLGGEIVTFDATLKLQMSGSGALSGFTRTLHIPVAAEIHTAPRTLGDPVQIFAAHLIALQGDIYGDPDFDLLSFRAGSAFGLPSPGEFELVRLSNGDFNVESFFDVTYEVDFAGQPGSILEGYSGTTPGTIRLNQGGPSLINAGNCVAPDNGTGTAELHVHCPYTAPNDVMYITNFPPGTTIECDPTINNYWDFASSPGGPLGGEMESFNATLILDMDGTGMLAGFTRLIAVPVEIETHSAPRNPGDPEQDFTTDFYTMFGQVFGDPDFDQLQITAGTGFSLPSPGNCTLTDLGDGNFNVESFFDVTYQIQFVGAPGSILEGFAGISTATIRIIQGSEPQDFWQELYEPPIFTVSMDMAFVITATEQECLGLCGDANNDGVVNVSDAVWIINYVFVGGGAPQPVLACGDANTDGTVNVSDAVWIINYVFVGGGPPLDCSPGSPEWIDGDCCPFIVR
jgi:Dockerin type I domain